MKRISYYLSAILALLFLSCGDEDKPELPGGGDDPDDPTKQETPVSIEITGEASWSPFASRATIDGNVVAWGDYESFRLYDEVGKKVSNTKMSFGKTNGAATGAFTGIVAYEEGARKFWAVFPYAVSFSTADSANAYPVAISATQNSASAASYLIGVASAAVTGNPGTDNPLTLEFKNVPALWDVDIVNNEGNSVKSVRVIVDPDGTTATDMPFVTEATIDLKKDYSTTPLRVTPVTYAASVSTTFAAVQTAPTFKATLFLLPATISGDLKIMVTLDDDTNLRFPLDGFNQEFASGTRFTSSIDLEDAEDDDPEPPEPDPDFEVSYDGVLTAYRGAGGDIRLPDNVTAVMDGNNALGTGIFQNNTTVTSIDLNNVVTLGINAFKGATGIVTVNAPNLEVIKAEGFHAAPNLVTVNSPKLKSIGDHCFQSCEALKTIDVSQVVELTGTNGGQRIFRLCKSLESIDMASFEGTIPFQMFIGCEKLVNVNLPKATAIGGTDDAGANRGQVFADCNLLTELSFPEATILSWRSVNALITRLSVPKVTTLRNQALAYCTELTYISLPSVTEIATNQFQGPSPAPIVIDFSEATGLTTVAANAFPDIAGIEIYVATEAIKALFLPAPTNTTITVGAPPPQP